MALNSVDLEAGMRRLAERRIEEAMKEGKFDNLPGAGKPLDLEPMPATEEARMTWWALKILRQNNFTPDEVQWRKQIDLLKESLKKITDPAKLLPLVARINGMVKQLNTLGTNAIKSEIAPVNLAEEQRRLAEKQSKNV